MKSYIETLVRWAAPKAGGLPKRPAKNLMMTVETEKLVLQDAQPLIEPTPAASPLKIEQTLASAPPKRWWSRDGRVSKTTEELELAITEAVKATLVPQGMPGVRGRD